MQKQRTTLVISAHSDDNMACACTLMKLKDQGYQLFEVILTDSREGLDFRQPSKPTGVSEVRSKELNEAGRYLGITEIFSLGQEDLNLSYSKELMLQVMSVIRKVRPEIVFIHNSYDAHIDHRAAHKLSLEACRWAGSGIRPDLGEKFRPNLILQMEGMIPGKPDLLVDVTDYAERKRELWKCYSSQASPDVVEFDQSVMRVRGNQLRRPGRVMAEAFTTCKLLPSILFD